MRHFLCLAAAVLLATPVLAEAGTLKPNSPYCTEMKLLVKYLGHLEANEQPFAERMLYRAQCQIKQTPEPMVLRADMDPYVKVETLEGFTVWARKADFTAGPDGK